MMNVNKFGNCYFRFLLLWVEDTVQVTLIKNIGGNSKKADLVKGVLRISNGT